MAGRKERLSFLIKFINDNAALTKVGWVYVVEYGCAVDTDGSDNRCLREADNDLRRMPRSYMQPINYGYGMATFLGATASCHCLFI